MATSTDPRLGAIRLAWWRERLEELDAANGAPAEPRLQAVANELLPLGITGLELSQLEDAWLPLLDDFPWDDAQAEGLSLRGRTLFRIGAKLLGAEVSLAEAAGALWSLQDGVRHVSDEPSRNLLARAARDAISRLPEKAPRSLRALSVLGALAACDALGRGRFGRGGAALKHRLTGRYPR